MLVVIEIKEQLEKEATEWTEKIQMKRLRTEKDQLKMYHTTMLQWDL